MFVSYRDTLTYELFLYSGKVSADSEIVTCEITKLPLSLKLLFRGRICQFLPKPNPTRVVLLIIGDKIWKTSCTSKIYRIVHFYDTQCTSLSTTLLLYTTTLFYFTTPLFYYYYVLLLTLILYNKINKTNAICQTISV